MPDETVDEKITKPLTKGLALSKAFLIFVAISLLLGGLTGYFLAKKPSTVSDGAAVLTQTPKSAEQDKRTFRDFAVGTIKIRSEAKDPSAYVEGTHLLEQDNSPAVALTSSVVDLSQYEGKRVKVFGETQKALKEGWLMDVGRVEEE